MKSDVDKDLLKVLYEEVSVIATYSLDVHEDSTKQLKEVCNKLNVALQDFESRLAATEEDVKDADDRLNAIRKEQNASRGDRKQTKCRLRRLEEEHTHFHENQDLLENAITKLETKQEGAEEEVLHIQAQQLKLEKKHANLEEEVKGAKKDLVGLTEKVRLLDDKMNEEDSPERFPGYFQAPNRNEYFSGRETELRKLEEIFGVSVMNSEDRNKVYGISGLGGCGKTTLVAEYSWRRRAFYTGGVFWISAESETLFRNTIVELAFIRRTFHDDFEQCLRATLASLGRNPLPFLVVVDNTDELELFDNVRKLLSGHWMRQSSAHILFTTRRKAEELHEIANVKLGDFMTLECMTMEEAISFMHKRTHTTQAAVGGRESSQLTVEDLEAVTELVDELGCLPLALEQAAAQIKVLECTFSQYLKQFREKKLALIRQKRARAPSEEVSKERLAVHTTWMMNFEYASILAKERGIKEFTLMVIEVLAFLSPDEVPYEVLNQAYEFESSVQGGDHSAAVDPTAVGSIVDILTKFSLFQSKSPKSLCVHRLVQEVIRSRCSVERRGEVILGAMRMLNFAFSSTASPTDVLGEMTDRPSDAENACIQENLLVTWATLASNAVTLKSHLAEFVTSHPHAASRVLHTRETVQLMREAAVYLSMMGQQVQAFESQKLALEISASGVQQEPSGEIQSELLGSPVSVPLTAHQVRILRLCCKNAEQPDTICQKKETDSEHATLDQLRLEGKTAFSSGDYKRAISLYSEAINLSLARPSSPVDVAVLHSNRSQCYLKLGKPNDAFLDAEECIKRDPSSWKGFCRRALAMKMLFEEGNEKYKLAYLASAAMAIHLNPTIEPKLRRIFGSAFCNISPKAISTQEQWEELIRETLGSRSGRREWIAILESGKYQISDELISITVRFPFHHIDTLILIGVGNVEIGNAQIWIGPESSIHFENIVFDKANLKIEGAFLSCSGCTFQNGIVTEDSECSGNPCEGCLVCHARSFQRDGPLCGGDANLHAFHESRIFVVKCTLRNSAGGIIGQWLLRICKRLQNVWSLPRVGRGKERWISGCSGERIV